MTARRQENKGRRHRKAALALVWVAAAFPAGRLSYARAGDAVTLTERVVVDRNTGLAIGGYDPVAYFTDGAAVLGQAAYEASQGGTVWRFCNESNRTFFLANPAIYGPQFGGYDPVDLTIGNIVAGRAQIWLVAERRLYLFNREDNKTKFAADPARFAREAADKWPVLRDTLADY
jgi:YHS domain-containing protein